MMRRMKRSAGVLLYRTGPDSPIELLLVHMGGPFWQNRDAGAWSIPKGEVEAGETPVSVALREFEEELGSPVPRTELVSLGEISQAGGKRVVIFAGEGDFDVSEARSNTFTIEWPPGSGKEREFPEVDRAAWVSPDAARVKLVKGQVAFVDRLLDLLGGSPPGDDGER